MVQQYRAFYELTVTRNETVATPEEIARLTPVAATLAMLQYATTGELLETSVFMDEARSLAAICADSPLRLAA